MKLTTISGLAVIAIAALMMFLAAGCSDNDKSPVDPAAKMNPLALDDTDRALNEPSIQEYSAGVARSRGILWKPVADSGGGLVILLNRSWGKPVVRVCNMQKGVIETGRFVYYSNPNRATYRFSRPGRAFPAPCLLQIGSNYFKVSQPSRRYE